jgi:hypothetical protein
VHYETKHLASGSPGLQITILAARVPRNAWQCAVKFGLTCPPPTDRTLAVPHQRSRSAPNVERWCHQPAYKSSAKRVGISTADAHREYPHTTVNTGNCVAVRT